MKKVVRSLAANITATLAAGLAVVVLLLALYMNREMHREVYGLINQKNDSILALQASNAALSLWNFDARQLQAIVDNVVRNEGIQSARIVSADGTLDVSAVNAARADPEYEAAPIERKIAHFDGGKSFDVGKIAVVPNYAEAAARIRDFSIRTIAGACALMALLVCALYVVTRRAIAPVTQLSRFMATSSVDAPPIQHADSRVNEVRQLFNALDQMRENYTRYQNELVAERDKAERASRVKSDFLATMSHELRTPLNSIMGLVDLLVKDEAMDAEQREMLTVVYKSSRVLLTIINDILDISKIESESMALEKTEFDLKDAVSGVVQTLLPIASSKGLTLSSSYDHPERAPHVLGDPVRLGRILTNLVGNALKYTEKGSVHLDIDFLPLDKGKVEFFCKVKDTGIGIAADKLDFIFERFTQADESITRKYGGTGLGLAIARELVTLMDGQIGVESAAGKGSTFWFRIPLEIVQRSSEAEAPRPFSQPVSSCARKAARAAKILLAEDHQLNQMFMKKLVRRLGIGRLDVMENGKLALDAYLSQGDYDLILMDCHMPEMNGYEATRAIRSHEEENGGHIPIIAMTADAMVGTRERCLRAGMDHYMSKPVNNNEFKKVLSEWIAFPGEAAAQDAGGKETVPEESPACVDLSVLRGFADSPEEIQVFVETFMRQAEADLRVLRAQCTEGGNEQWRATAHRMKGGCGGAGALVMHGLCREAQEMIIATKAEREAKCAEIEKAYEDAKEYFKELA